MRGMEAEPTSDVCEPANPVQIRLELRCDVLRTSHDYVCSYSRSCAMRAHLVDRLWGQRAMGGGRSRCSRLRVRPPHQASIYQANREATSTIRS